MMFYAGNKVFFCIENDEVILASIFGEEKTQMDTNILNKLGHNIIRSAEQQ